MIKSKLVPQKGGFHDKIKALIKAGGDTAEVGWFDAQGKHESIDMTYPELAKFHATGQDGVTARPMLAIALSHYKNSGGNKDISKALKTFLDNPSQANRNDIIEAVGLSFWKELKWVMGNPAALHVTNNPTPLEDTGDLKAHVARRTNRRKSLKTTP